MRWGGGGGALTTYSWVVTANQRSLFFQGLCGTGCVEEGGASK